MSVPDMTVKEAAEYLGMGQGAVYELASEGTPAARKIRSYRFGRNVGRAPGFRAGAAEGEARVGIQASRRGEDGRDPGEIRREAAGLSGFAVTPTPQGVSSPRASASAPAEVGRGHHST